MRYEEAIAAKARMEEIDRNIRQIREDHVASEHKNARRTWFHYSMIGLLLVLSGINFSGERWVSAWFQVYMACATWFSPKLITALLRLHRARGIRPLIGALFWPLGLWWARKAPPPEVYLEEVDIDQDRKRLIEELDKVIASYQRAAPQGIQVVQAIPVHNRRPEIH